eukprot:4266749-Pyramimonas_sp.AAC.1
MAPVGSRAAAMAACAAASAIVPWETLGQNENRGNLKRLRPKRAKLGNAGKELTPSAPTNVRLMCHKQNPKTH